MLILRYLDEGEPVPDSECEDLVIDCIKSPNGINTNLAVCTDNIIHAALALLAEGKINLQDIEIYIYGEELLFNCYLQPLNPDILPKYRLDWVRRAITAVISARKSVESKSSTSDGVDNKISV